MLAAKLTRWSYQRVAKPILFLQDPENVHQHVLRVGRFLGNTKPRKQIVRRFFHYQNPSLAQTVCGIRFENPIGLAAGFDQDADLTQVLASVGFGFEEVGSITAERCEGNPRPRLWRHPDLRSLRVYYGLKNKGCEDISEKLSRLRFDLPIGISMAKTNSEKTTDVDAGIADYVTTYKTFSNIESYDTLNISCPNPFGGEPFCAPERLEKLLGAIHTVRNKKPIFLKLSPEHSLDELNEIALIAKKHKINGLICSNLIKKHGFGKGGLSGKPVEHASNTHLEHLYKNFSQHLILISCGGIWNGQEAYERIRHGASLLQLITGMVYQGPQLIGEINRDLALLLKREGYNNISEAIGAAYK